MRSSVNVMTFLFKKKKTYDVEGVCSSKHYVCTLLRLGAILGTGAVIPNLNTHQFSVHLLKLCPRFCASKYLRNHTGLFGVYRLIRIVNQINSLSP